MEGSTNLNPDLGPLMEAATEFSSYSGLQNDESVKNFLDRFPLPVVFGALEREENEWTLVDCLDRIFKTRHGASLIPHYVQFVQVGLQVNSQLIRCLACNVIYYLLENAHDGDEHAIQLIIEYGLYPLLLRNLIDGNEVVAAAATEAIKNLAQFPKGISLIFPVNLNDAVHLKNAAAHCSSLARIRILALIAKLFAISSPVASSVYNSNLLSLFEAEICNSTDMLSTMSALELLYELAESPHGTNFLLRTTLLQLLTSLISNTSVESVLRSRAIQICGRLLSSSEAFSVIDETSITSSIMVINGRLELLKNQNIDECENALEALGQIGSSIQGAQLLLANPSPVAKHVVELAFYPHGRGKQMAALLALGSICGANRSYDRIMVKDDAEECLRCLIYATAANSSKLTPSGLYLSVLQQDPEVRLAAYRLIAVLVVRPWSLMEVCSKQEIINVVTDAKMETTKKGMEARHECCVAISNALSTSNRLNDAALAGIAAKLQEAVKRGPYLAKRHIEAQPVVVTADRF